MIIMSHYLWLIFDFWFILNFEVMWSWNPSIYLRDLGHKTFPIPNTVLSLPYPVLHPLPHPIPYFENPIHCYFLGWIAASLAFYDGSEYKLHFAKLNNILTRPRDLHIFDIVRNRFSPRNSPIISPMIPYFWQKLLHGKKFANFTFIIRLTRMSKFILILNEKSSE